MCLALFSEFDLENLESPWYPSLKNTSRVVLDRHLLHLLDIVLAISAQGVLRDITVIKVTEIHISEYIFSVNRV